MKKSLRIISFVLCSVILLALCSCNKVTNTSSNRKTVTVGKKKYENVEIPKISSQDEVMPTYFDISLYNFENYSDLYLGDDFEYKINYVDDEITLPISYSEFTEAGFTLKESTEYNENSVILAGKNLSTQFLNKNGNVIDALFFNDSDKSVELKNCEIVKLSVLENCILDENSAYGTFFANGITNQSAITDIVEFLGAPSHFYAVSKSEYYLDYFLSHDDIRSRITIYINPQDDTVRKIEFSKYS